jgi:translation elongation factor EF-4
MFVEFRGHGNLLLTEYNGIRYAFHKGIPAEITQEVYNNMRDSGHIDMQELVICEEKKESIVEKIKETIVRETSKPKAKHGHKPARK